MITRQHIYAHHFFIDLLLILFFFFLFSFFFTILPVPKGSPFRLISDRWRCGRHPPPPLAGREPIERATSNQFQAADFGYRVPRAAWELPTPSIGRNWSEWWPSDTATQQSSVKRNIYFLPSFLYDYSYLFIFFCRFHFLFSLSFLIVCFAWKKKKRGEKKNGSGTNYPTENKAGKIWERKPVMIELPTSPFNKLLLLLLLGSLNTITSVI